MPFTRSNTSNSHELRIKYSGVFEKASILLWLFSVKLYFNQFLNMASLFQQFDLTITKPFILHFTIPNYLNHINMVSLVEKQPYLTKLANYQSNKEHINCFPPGFLTVLSAVQHYLLLAILQSPSFKSKIPNRQPFPPHVLLQHIPSLYFFFPFTEDITHFPL